MQSLQNIPRAPFQHPRQHEHHGQQQDKYLHITPSLPPPRRRGQNQTTPHPVSCTLSGRDRAFQRPDDQRSIHSQACPCPRSRRTGLPSARSRVRITHLAMRVRVTGIGWIVVERRCPIPTGCLSLTPNVSSCAPAFPGPSTSRKPGLKKETPIA